MLSEIKKICQRNGWILLSDKYRNSRTNLKFRCSEGHEWYATTDNVKNKNTTCKKCSDKIKGEKRRLNPKVLSQIAKERGGEFLKIEYTII